MTTINVRYNQENLKDLIDTKKIQPLDKNLIYLNKLDIEQLSEIEKTAEQVGPAFNFHGKIGSKEIEKLLQVYTPMKADSYMAKFKKDSVTLAFYSTKPVEKIVLD
jgi:hypothetical protein